MESGMDETAKKISSIALVIGEDNVKAAFIEQIIGKSSNSKSSCTGYVYNGTLANGVQFSLLDLKNGENVSWDIYYSIAHAYFFVFDTGNYKTLSFLTDLLLDVEKCHKKKKDFIITVVGLPKTHPKVISLNEECLRCGAKYEEVTGNMPLLLDQIVIHKMKLGWY